MTDAFGSARCTTLCLSKSNADILVVQPAENWAAKNLPGPFDGTGERRILLQGEMCAGAIIICHIRQQQASAVQMPGFSETRGPW
jgi:hypothetical protein